MMWILSILLMTVHLVLLQKIQSLLESLEKVSNTLFQWFMDNPFKGNFNKCHLIVSTNQNVNIGEYDIESSNCEKILWVKIDNKLAFDFHVSGICKKASKKINVLAREAPYINIDK